MAFCSRYRSRGGDSHRVIGIIGGVGGAGVGVVCVVCVWALLPFILLCDTLLLQRQLHRVSFRE